MSASNKKKLRKEENMAKLTERQQAEQKEAKLLKRNTTIFVVAIALVLAIGVGMIAYNWFTTTGLPQRWTTAVEIGEHKLSVADLNYYYIDMLNKLSQDWYSMYLLQLEDGFDSTKALDQQLYHGEAGKTWGDYFVEEAIKEASGVLALVDAAKAEGYTLSETELTSIDDTIVAMETEGWLYGYTKVDDFLQAIYGHGATIKSYRTYVENLTLAQSYYNNYVEKLEYSADEMNEYEAEQGSYSSFDYTYFMVDPDDFITHEDGTDTHEHTDEELAAALAQAKEAADALVASGAKTEEELNKAIAALEIYGGVQETTEETTEEATTEEATTEETTTEETTTEETTPAETTGETTPAETTGETTPTETTEPEEETTEEPTTSNAPTATVMTGKAYSEINTAIAEWLIGSEHEAGDIAAVPYYALDEEGNKTETVESYYVVIFGAEDKHEDKLVTVRHILKSYTGGTTDEESGGTVYSDEDKKAAEDKIIAIKSEWESGEKTAESFGELAKTNSDDSSASKGGLYEDVYPGWAMEEFDAWCFDETRKTGDVGVVHTDYGCHLIYFVEVQDTTYREFMITTDMRAEDSEAWYTGLRDALKATAKVGNTSSLNTGIIMSN